MSTDLNANFNEQYMSISTKLKKRFLRKPNISEATNEFIALAIQCEHSEQPTFAGHCYIGAAKCEATIGNFLGEAEYYLAAARQFMKAEKKIVMLKFHSADRENLEAAIGCYMQAFNKYPDRSQIRVSILMEIAKALVNLNHKLEAEYYYQQALDLVEEKTLKVMCLRNLLNLQIDSGKYNSALDTANLMIKSNFCLPENICSEMDINRILLTLIEEPSEENRPESLKTLFSKLLNDESEDLPFNTDLKLKIQSIVVCCNTKDVSSLIDVCSDTKEFLTFYQKQLLDVLVQKVKTENLVFA